MTATTRFASPHRFGPAPRPPAGPRGPSASAADAPRGERTQYQRTNDRRYVVRTVDSRYADGRITRSSYLIDTVTGARSDQRHLVSYDGGATWQKQ
jgi:hypothetical protein